MIPFFFSFDRNLRGLIRSYPIKVVFIDRWSGSVLSIPELNTYEYFKGEGCEEIMASFFSVEKINERFSRERPGLEILLSRIRSEYKELCTILLH